MALVNELIGSFGKYQLWICFIIFMSKFGVAFHQLAIIFLAPPVDYRCPNRNEACCDNPIFNTSIFTRTIVMEWNLICEKSWLKELNQTLFQFGVLSGSLILGIVSDKYGRRPTLIFSVILEVFSGVMTSFLTDYWSFTIVRVILGFSVGGVMVISFVIVMEYVGNENRDVVSALYQLPFTVGHMVLALFGYLIRDYVYFQLVISLSNCILLLYICILPETPRWLLAAGKTVEAIVLMEKVAKINNLPTEDIERRIEIYQIEHNQDQEKRGSVVDLFKTPNIRKNILIMSFLWLVCSYCFYGVAQYVSHLTGDIYLASGSVCLCACIISIPLMRFMGRRTVVTVSNTACGLCLLVIAFIPEGAAATCLACFGVLFTFIVFIVVYLYCTEMFPTVVRNAALGITSMMARVGAMVAPFVVGLRPYGQWCAPVTFGVFPLLAAFLCTMLPETKNCELMTTIEQGEALCKQNKRIENTSNAAFGILNSENG